MRDIRAIVAKIERKAMSDTLREYGKRPHLRPCNCHRHRDDLRET